MFVKPLFSRKQLNIIIVVTTLAIAVLSTTGSDPLPTIEKAQPAGKNVFFIDKSTPVSRLRLSFPLPNNGHSSQFQPQLMYQMITNRLKQQSIDPANGWPPISLSLQHDRLQLQINTDTLPSAGQLTRLIQWLGDEFSPQQWAATAERLQADRYIRQSSNPSVLMQMAPLLGIDLSPQLANAHFAYQQQLINRDQLRVSYVGPDAEDWLTLIASMIEALPQSAGGAEQPLLWPYPVQKQQKPIGYKALLARTTVGYHDADATLEQAAIYLIQGVLETSQSSDWQAQASQGLLLITSQTQRAKPALTMLKQQIVGLSPDQIESRMEQSIDALEAVAENPEKLLNRVENVALYNLPLDYLPQLAQAIETLDTSDIQTKATELLAAEDFFWISQ